VFIRSTSASVTGPVRVGDTSVQPIRTVRDLGVYIDADVTMSAHVTAVVKACFAALRQIRSVCRSLTRTTLLTLVHALVTIRIGGLLQLSSLGYLAVFNAAARLVFFARSQST